MINTLFLTLQLSNLLLLLSFSTRKYTSMAYRAILSNFFESRRASRPLQCNDVNNGWCFHVFHGSCLSWVISLMGCLLGPLLFNIHINDVNYSVSNMALRLYADDTTGYNSDIWSLALQFMVNKNLSSFPTWFKQNLLSINNT